MLNLGVRTSLDFIGCEDGSLVFALGLMRVLVAVGVELGMPGVINVDGSL